MAEHPEDRRMRLESVKEAKETIGPFWRKRWRRFVALVQTYPDDKAHELLDVLREDYWGERLPKGPPPTPPRSSRPGAGKERGR